MNRYIKAKPLLIITFLIFVIITFLIYAAPGIFTTTDGGPFNEVKPDGESLNVSRAPTPGSESEQEKQTVSSAQEYGSLPAASRGDVDRYSDQNQPDSAEGKLAGSASAQSAEAVEIKLADPAAVRPLDPAPVTLDLAVSAEPNEAVQTEAQAQVAAEDKPAADAVTPASASQPETKETAEVAQSTQAVREAPAPVAQSAPAAPAAAAEPAKPAPAPEPAAAPATESGDLDLLARLITAEAQGEPYEAQVAVGAVVMNRVKSGNWANSIQGVIYQKYGEYYQFTPVQNGWIDKPAQRSAIEAAKAAMNGSDPTSGSQFYYDDKCTNEWILAKPVSIKIGHMIFAF